MSIGRRVVQQVALLPSRLLSSISVAPDLQSLIYVQADQLGIDLFLAEKFR
jgi:hypothetical protein